MNVKTRMWGGGDGQTKYSKLREWGLQMSSDVKDLDLFRKVELRLFVSGVDS